MFNPRTDASVFLPFQTQGHYPEERGKEPQVVKVLSQNRAKFWLRGEVPPYSNTSWQFPAVGGQRVKRLAISRVRLLYNILNVNTANNTIVIIRNNGAGVYTEWVATIPPGQYSYAQLVTATVAALNTALGAGFAAVVSPNNPNLYILSYVSGLNSVAFATTTANGLVTATATNNSAGLGLPSYPLTAGGYASLAYSDTFYLFGYGFGVNYYDICSRSLTMDSKTMLPDLDAASGMLARVYLPNPTHGQIDVTYDEPIGWINVEERPITSVDLQLVPSQRYNASVNAPPNYPLARTEWGLTKLKLEVEVTIEY